MEIWINPACSKCRSALSILDAEGAGYTVRRYLDEPPTAQELRDMLGRLGLEPWDVVRDGEDGVLVPRGAPPVLAQALRDLAIDPERRAEGASDNENAA